MSYRSYQTTNGPPWMLGPQGIKWQAGLGDIKDKLLGSLRTAIKYRFPTYAKDDPSGQALALIGADRLLDRAPGESDDDYAARLRMAWEAWQRAGTPLGLLLAIEVFYPTATFLLVQQAKWAYSLDPDTSLAPEDRLELDQLGDIRGEPGWWFDNNAGLPPSEGFWSRFGLLFPDSAALPAGWGPIPTVSPPGPTTDPTTDEVNQLIRLVQLWKPAKATCEWIKVVTAGNIWGMPPSLQWGAAGLNWGSSTVVTWSGSTPY